MTSLMRTHDERKRRRGRRGAGDRGAALVEFAIIMPVLFLLIFAVIEFGWAFFQELDVRHAAREGGRLAAVDYRSTATSGDTQRDEIIAETCARMDDQAAASVGFHRSGTAEVGQEIVVTVELDLGNGLTGFIAPFLPDTLRSQVSTRIEQPAQWSSMASGAVTACP
jgi:Flp pilus assembly protein TadG